MTDWQYLGLIGAIFIAVGWPRERGMNLLIAGAVITVFALFVSLAE